MSIFNISKRSALSALLTDIMPFEVPLFFSISGFHSYFSGRGKFPLVDEVIRKYKKDFSEPYNYDIHVNDEKIRTLSIVHPSSMISMAEFYDKNHAVIISSCSRSRQSMRKPVSVARKFYLRGFIENIREIRAGESVESALDEQKYASSYFSYSDYNLLGHFFESDEIIGYEKKYPFHIYFDVSKCFYNIYTHSVSWAVQGKENAKENKERSSFSSDFDILMQKANYNETNGVVVGPEISRIFSEIIFQDIDVLVVNLCEVDKSLIYGKDFVVRRYIDDFFIYGASEAVVRDVYRCYISILADYKLYVNESKSSGVLRPPYITDVSLAKREISKGFQKFSDDLGVYSISKNKRFSISSLARSKRLRKTVMLEARGFNYSRVARRYIDFIRAAIGKRDAVSRESFSSYILSIVSSKSDEIYILSSQISGAPLESTRYVFAVLNVLARVAFYVYMQKPTVSSLYSLCKIIVRINSSADALGGTYNEILRNYIVSELDGALERFSCFSTLSKVELLNVLIVKRLVGGSVTEDFLRLHGLIPSHDGFAVLGYFEIVGIYFLLRNDISSDLSDSLIDEVSARISRSGNSLRKTENALLFFDLSCCPFLSKSSKRKILGAVADNLNMSISDEKLNRWIKEMLEYNFFVQWDSFDLEVLIQKKRLRTAY